MRFRLFLALSALLVSPLKATTVWVEASQLEFSGGWDVNGTVKGKEVRQYLVAGTHARQAPAAGAVQVPHAGKWRLWVRSKDFPADRPGTRTFSVRLGKATSSVVFGKHGRAELDGWAWEDGGFFELPAGPTLIVLGESVASSARCDALILTDNTGYHPEGVPWKLAKPPAEKAPLFILPQSQRGYLPEPLISVEDQPLAVLENEAVRFAFNPAQTSTGQVVALRASVREGDRWRSVNEDAGAESYRVLYRPRASDPKRVRHGVFPRWDTTLSPLIDAEAGGNTVHTRTGIDTAPWASGKCLPLRPLSVRQLDPHTVTLSFPACEAGSLEATWSQGNKTRRFHCI